MEHIEKGLQDIENKYNETQTKQYKILLDTINKTAKQVSNNCSSFDAKIRKTFPDCPQKPDTYNVFNPKKVVVFDYESKVSKTIDSWDNTEGILPNHYFTYSIRLVNCHWDIGLYKHIEQLKPEDIFNRLILQINNQCNVSSCSFNNKNGNGIRHRHTCGQNSSYSTIHYGNGNGNGNNNKNVYKGYNNSDIDINTYNIASSEYCQVDNYNNIYLEKAGLYLMFNKTPFPQFAFYSNHKYSDIYFLPRDMCNIMHKDILESKDNEKLLLDGIINLLPENLSEINNYYNNVRKLFNHFTIDKESLDNIMNDDIPEMDLKDMIIREYKEKLESYIKENKVIRDKILDLEQLFIDKSNQVIDLERRFNHKELEVKEELEKLEIEKFKFKSDELNTDLLKQKFTSLMETNEKSKTKLSDYEIKYNKIKDINNGLLEKLKLVKNNLEEYKEINSRYEKEIISHKEELLKLNDSINENNKKVIEYKTKNNELEQRLLNSASTSTDALEVALSEQNNDLKTQIQELNEQIRKLTTEKNKFELTINTYKSTLNNLLNESNKLIAKTYKSK
jgi:hypothetical protein